MSLCADEYRAVTRKTSIDMHARHVNNFTTHAMYVCTTDLEHVGLVQNVQLRTTDYNTYQY